MGHRRGAPSWSRCSVECVQVTRGSMHEATRTHMQRLNLPAAVGVGQNAQRRRRSRYECSHPCGCSCGDL